MKISQKVSGSMKKTGPFGPAGAIRAVLELDAGSLGRGGDVDEVGDVPHDAVGRVLDAPGDVELVEYPYRRGDEGVQHVGRENSGDLAGMIVR